MKTFASYGSLRKGFWNHTRFGLGEPIATSTVKGSMFMNASLGYPWLFNEEDAKAMEAKIIDYTVELFDVDEEKFNRIDMMEQGSGYKAQEMTFELPNGTKQNAIVWFADPLAIKPKPEQFIEEYKAPK